MESARVAFYLFDELVAEEEELYDKRVKTLANQVIGIGELAEKRHAELSWNRVPFSLVE